MGDYEVQGWRGWHHHQTLAFLALWFLVLQQRRWGKKNGRLGMTLPAARRLLQTVLAVALVGDPRAHAIRLSNWRQQQNLVARLSHAKTRARARRKRLRNTG